MFPTRRIGIQSAQGSRSCLRRTTDTLRKRNPAGTPCDHPSQNGPEMPQGNGLEPVDGGTTDEALPFHHPIKKTRIPRLI